MRLDDPTRRRGLRLSIRVKFGLIIAALILFLMAATTYAILNQVRRSFVDEIKLRGRLLAETVAYDVANLLFYDDQLLYTQVVGDAARHEGVAYAFLLDGSGRYAVPPVRLTAAGRLVCDTALLRTAFRTGLRGAVLDGQDFAAAATIDRQGRPVYEVAVPVRPTGARTIGEVHVGLNLEPLERTTRRVEYLILAITLAGVGLALVGSFSLTGFLVRPIQALVVGARQIGAGNFDHRIAVRGRDELGDLTVAFNQMAVSLKEKEQIKDAFRRYVSPHVAEEIFRNPEESGETLTGARRRIAVLFADIRGFTPLTERLAPEEVVALLNTYFSALTEIVFGHGGTVDKFIGDCIMAVFGAPVRHADDARRAVQAALDIQQWNRDWNAERRHQGLAPIEVGIGINLGEAVVGNIGSQARVEYTSVGSCVNLGQQLQEHARGGEILVSDALRAETAADFTYEPTAPLSVKGSAARAVFYRLTGVRALTSPAPNG